MSWNVLFRALSVDYVSTLNAITTSVLTEVVGQ